MMPPFGRTPPAGKTFMAAEVRQAVRVRRRRLLLCLHLALADDDKPALDWEHLIRRACEFGARWDVDPAEFHALAGVTVKAAFTDG
jgi:hypothetical protein